ncbi:MAG: hypothetical protein PHW35_15115 [Lentimicrobiaceae bacterium]|jgi:hypothetical protein|nr:hypothetical protein [Lentimicrobiaceae bacterium]
MKKLVCLISIITIFSCSAKGQTGNKNREQLKEYFLCCCIYHGFNNTGIAELDNSKSIYFDILQYKLPAMQKVDSLAKAFVNSMEVSGYEKRKTRGIIILSIEEYKSKKLDTFIRTLDKYILKE